MAAGAGELPHGLIGQRLTLEHTLASMALRTGQPQRIADPLNRTRSAEHELGHLGLSADDGLVVPLAFRAEPYGVLVAVDRLDGTRFSEQHERLLRAFATSTAVAIATAKSAADERRRQTGAAREAERARWADELRDETLEGLATLRLALVAESSRAREANELAAVIDHAITALESEIAKLRALISGGRSSELDELGRESAPSQGALAAPGAPG